MNTDRALHTSYLGTKKYPVDCIPVQAAEGHQRKGGGGGLARAFVSHLASSHRRADGKLDLTTIWFKYREEKAKAFSPLLESLREEAKLATKAREEQVRQGKRWTMSSFGAVRPRSLKYLRKESDVRALRDRLESAVSPPAVSAPSQLQIVPVEAGSWENRIQEFVGHDVSSQLALLRSLGRLQSKEARLADEKEEQDAREQLEKSSCDDLYGVKLSDFSDENASVRAYMTGDILDVHVHRDAASFVNDRVAGMVQQSKSAVAR